MAINDTQSYVWNVRIIWMNIMKTFQHLLLLCERLRVFDFNLICSETNGMEVDLF